MRNRRPDEILYAAAWGFMGMVSVGYYGWLFFLLPVGFMLLRL